MTLHLEQIVVSEEGQSGFREGQSFLAEIANKWNHQVFRKHYIIAIGASSEPIFSDYVSTTLSVFVWSDWEIKLVFCRRQAWLVNGGRKCYRNPFYQVATWATFIGQPIFQLLLPHCQSFPATEDSHQGMKRKSWMEKLAFLVDQPTVTERAFMHLSTEMLIVEDKFVYRMGSE